MADASINLGLVKPSDNETADIQVINKNMDKIDAAVAKKVDSNSMICGSGTFNGTTGVSISHAANTTNYIAQITMSSSDPNGAVGIFWVESKTETSFIVKNTGDVGFHFDWLLMKLAT